MSLMVECEMCGMKYRVGNHRAGQDIPCKKCGDLIEVPGRRRRQSRFDEFDEADATSSSPLPLIIGGAALAGVIVIGVLLVVLLNRGGDQPEGGADNLQAGAAAGRDGNETAPQPAPGSRIPVSTQPAGNNWGTGSETTTTGGTTSTPGSNRRSATNPAAPSATWTTGSDAGIPFDSSEGLTFGPSGCPVFVLGNTVWELSSSKPVGTLQGEYSGRGTSALSPDGKWFAVADKSQNQRDTAVRVWNTVTGLESFTAPGDPEKFSDAILLSNERLFIGGRLSNQLRMWELETGEELKPLESPGKGIKGGNFALTPDGKYIATVAHDRLVVLNVDSGKVAATMAAPKKMERPGNGQAIVVRNNRVVADSRASSNDSIFIYAWLQSLKFSPDVSALAGISTHPRPRIICWDQRGKLVLDDPLYIERMAFWKHTMVWMPNGKGWLIAGNLFDLESRRVVLSIRKKFAQDLHVYPTDDDHLIGNFPSNPSRLQVLEIPWKGIRESLAQLESDEPALLSPAQPVSIQIKIAALRGGNQSQTANMIRAALEQRLARDGIRVSPGQATYFQLRFAEKAGDELPIYERQSPFDFRGQDTGRTAVEAKGSLIVELIIPGRPGPIWRDTIAATSSRSFDKEINDKTIRASMLDRLARSVNELSFPYFIPKSPDKLALPLIVE